MADAAYIPRLWQMIDTAQQKLQPSRDQVSAWERASGMLSNHASRLQDCRNQLATLWPPEQNAASAAYMAELDRLIQAAQQTSTAAQNNATHIGHVADAIDQARVKLKPIYDEYVKNQALLADYQKQVEKAGDLGGLVGGAAGQSWGLGALGRKAGDFLGENAMETFTSPPVSDAQQAALVARARAVQVEVDGAARDGSNRVQPPPEYIPPHLGKEQENTNSVNRTRARVPPEVDPPPHRRAEPDDTKPGYIEGTPPPDLHTEHTPPNITTPTYPPEGPSLTGVTPPTTTLPGPTLPPTPPVPTPPPTVTPGLPVGPPYIGGAPPVGPVNTGGGPRVPGPTGRVGLGPTAISTGVPPGGVIGARPGGGVGGVPGGVGGVGGAPRANPVGGVIGQSGQGAGRPGAAGAIGGAGAGRGPSAGRAGAAGGTGSSGMIGGQRGRQTRDEQDTRHWDPDNPWAVEEGVAPEIEPNRTVGRHEPGTGVIGKDR